MVFFFPLYSIGGDVRPPALFVCMPVLIMTQRFRYLFPGIFKKKKVKLMFKCLNVFFVSFYQILHLKLARFTHILSVHNKTC